MSILYRVMKSINYFPISNIEYGDFEIKDGIIAVKQSYLIGQYIYIPGAIQRNGKVKGSILNEGIYLVSDNLITLPEARDESFAGAVCGLVISEDFIELCSDIENYVNLVEKDPKQALLVSESFGGYSYGKATNSDGVPPRWQQVFNQSLMPYRKMFPPRIF